ncbi:MAG: hypothetical protein AAFR21_14965 [Pseudomonadota bacterium]
MEKGKFWFVWNPQGNNPRHMHGSKESAEAEARRLAQKNRGQQFFVLRSVSGFTVELPPPPPIIEIYMDEYVYDNIPF